MTAELRETLVPPDEAKRIAVDHQTEATETWTRAVSAAVSSLLALHDIGYTLQRP